MTEQCVTRIKPAVSDIIERLERGEFLNEAAVSTGVVTRLLDALGWEIYNPAVVWPQYSTDSGRVDFALCHPPRTPYIFVEVKSVGKAREGESQAFRYAFDKGVHILVVTDGKGWFLYLPTGQGGHSERQFYALDLLERSLDDCADTFCRFLGFDMVVSGKALDEARKKLSGKQKGEKIRRTMPDAWNRLLSEADEELQVLLSEQVEKMCGYAPSIESIEDFLRKQAGSIRPLSSPVVPPARPLETTPERPTTAENGGMGGTTDLLYARGKLIGFKLTASAIGELTETPGNAKRTLEALLKALQNLDHSFLPRLSAHPESRGNQGALFVARNQGDLNPRHPHVAEEHGVNLGGGWWMGGPYSQAGVITRVKLACKVAGFRLAMH